MRRRVLKGGDFKEEMASSPRGWQTPASFLNLDANHWQWGILLYLFRFPVWGMAGIYAKILCPLLQFSSCFVWIFKLNTYCKHNIFIKSITFSKLSKKYFKYLLRWLSQRPSSMIIGEGLISLSKFSLRSANQSLSLCQSHKHTGIPFLSTTIFLHLPSCLTHGFPFFFKTIYWKVIRTGLISKDLPQGCVIKGCWQWMWVKKLFSSEVASFSSAIFLAGG